MSALKTGSFEAGVFGLPVDFHLGVTRWGCGQKLGLFLGHKAEALTVFDRASVTKRHFNAGFVIPADVGIHLLDELSDGEAELLPVL